MERVLDLCPNRAPNAETQPEGEELRVTVSRSPNPGARLLSYILNMPVRKSFMLDRHGARIWEMCDGKRPVRSIVSQLASEHGWPEERAKEAVLIYLSALSRRKLMSFGPVASDPGGE